LSPAIHRQGSPTIAKPRSTDVAVFGKAQAPAAGVNGVDAVA
jgi:hypothetical protein